MGGRQKTSTHDVTRKAPRYPYLRSKMGTVSGVLPKLSGHLTMRMLQMKRLCFLTCRAVVVSLTNRGERYAAAVAMDPYFKENLVSWN